MRVIGLDFLRGVAVLLVIFRHASGNNILYKIGWAGVDLFFVLSGFLVASIVFKEYLESKDFNATRFLVRRGFKIYPPFYLFILVTIVLNYIETGGLYALGQIFNEVFFLQSYREGLWQHTWSLAVEEHFYIGLALFAVVCIKAKLIENRKLVAYGLICLLIMSLLMRFQLSFENRDKPFFVFTSTHLRLDGILIGVLTSYLFYFTDSYQLFIKYKYWFLGFAAILISPVFFFQGGGYFMNTIGLTTVNLGFSLIVLFSLTCVEMRDHITSSLIKIPLLVISFIGIHSYSIYLWHLMPAKILSHTDHNLQHYFARFSIIALFLGVIMSYAVEKPFLRLRDLIYKRQ